MPNFPLKFRLPANLPACCIHLNSRLLKAQSAYCGNASDSLILAATLPLCLEPGSH